MTDSSLVKWINTFTGVGECNSLSDLSDGIIFYDIGSQLIPKYFNEITIKRENNDDWVVKSDNIKKVLDGIEEFYRNEIGVSLPSEVDVDAVTNSDESEISKIIEMLIGVVLECENKNEFIENIMRMDQESQNDLMIIIEKIQTGNHDKQQQQQNQTTTSSSTSNSANNKNNQVSEEKLIALQSQIEKLQKEKENMQADYDELNIQLMNTTKERNDVMKERESFEELTNHLKEELEESQRQLEETMSQTSSLNAMADQKIQEELKSLHTQIESKDRQISDLKKKADDSAKQMALNRSLRDEIDILREKVDSAKATEDKLKNYQKKIEDINDLKRKIKDLEEQNENYLQQTLDLEDQLEKYSSIRGQAESSKHQISSLQIEITKLELSLKSTKEERDKLSTTIGSIENDRTLLLSQVESLRSKVDQLEQEKESKLLEQNSQESSGGLGEIIDNSGNRERMIRLERENKKLKEKQAELEQQIQNLETAASTTTTTTSTASSSTEADSEKEALKLQIQEITELYESTKKQLEETNLNLDEVKKQCIELYEEKQKDGDQEKVNALNTEITTLNTEVDRLRGCLRAARNRLVEFREKSKAYQEMDIQMEEKDKYIAKLEQTLKKKHDQIVQLVNQNREGREESQRELNLMLSAFLKVGIEMEQVKLQNNIGPRSFLNKKRGDVLSQISQSLNLGWPLNYAACIEDPTKFTCIELEANLYITSMIIEGFGASLEINAQLSNLAELKSLSLGSVSITGNTFQQINSIPKLESLSILNTCIVPSSGLDYSAYQFFNNLKKLHLFTNLITVSNLPISSNMVDLSIEGNTNFSSNFVNSPNIKILTLKVLHFPSIRPLLNLDTLNLDFTYSISQSFKPSNLNLTTPYLYNM
eukprot:gene603-751_t